MSALHSPDVVERDPSVAALRVSIFHVPHCPLVDTLRERVEAALAETALTGFIEEIQGPYLSPTLLIDEVALPGFPLEAHAACRIDLPTQHEIMLALLAAGGGEQPSEEWDPNDSQRDPTHRARMSCGGRALCGLSPPSLVANTALKRRIDLVLRRNWASIGLVVAVIGLLNLAARLSIRPALVVYAVTGLTAGGWCLLNFWRCRHAHCLITGPGWLAFGMFALIEASLGRSVIGGSEEAVFFGILGIAALFEIGWYARYRTNAVSASNAA